MQLRLLQEIEFVGKFWVGITVRDVASGRDVKVMDYQRSAGRGDRCAKVPAIAFIAPVGRVFSQAEGQPRVNCHSIIALHTAPEGIRQTYLFTESFWEKVVGYLGFLQAKYIRLQRFNQAVEMRLAQSEGVNIPSGYREGHIQLLAAF